MPSGVSASARGPVSVSFSSDSAAPEIAGTAIRRLKPTAQTLLLATALTLVNSATDEPAGVGAATTDQLVPLKISVSGPTSPLLVL